MKLLILIVIMALTSCSTPQSFAGAYRNADLRKPLAEVAALKKKAAGGDKNAAWTLFLHYGLGLANDKAAEPWLNLADKLGNVEAKRLIKARRLVKSGEGAR